MLKLECVKRFETLRELANVNNDVCRTLSEVARQAVNRLHGTANNWAHVNCYGKNENKVIDAHVTLGYAFGDIEIIRDLCDELLQKYAEK